MMRAPAVRRASIKIKQERISRSTCVFMYRTTSSNARALLTRHSQARCRSAAVAQPWHRPAVIHKSVSSRQPRPQKQQAVRLLAASKVVDVTSASGKIVSKMRVHHARCQPAASAKITVVYGQNVETQHSSHPGPNVIPTWLGTRAVEYCVARIIFDNHP